MPFRSITSILAATILGVAGAAMAQDSYPEGPVTVVVTYSPGGSSDLSARTLASTATDALGKQIVVTNRAGAGGITGMTAINNAEADGYTLGLGRVATLAVVPAVNKSISYDIEDITYLGLLEKNPNGCVTGADRPFENLNDLIEAIKAEPGKLIYSSSGVGTLTHLASAMVLDATDLDDPANAAIHIPQRGEGAAVTAVVNGSVDFFCGNLPPMLGNIQSGQLKPLVVMLPERDPALPEVSTAAELGHPELEAVVGWSALVGPPGLSEEVVAKWTEVLSTTGDSETYQNFVKRLGSTPAVMGPEETRSFVLKQYETFNELAERLNLRTVQ